MGTPDRQDIHGQAIDRHIDILTPGELRPARPGGGDAGESSADAERPAQEEAVTEIDEISKTYDPAFNRLHNAIRTADVPREERKWYG